MLSVVYLKITKNKKNNFGNYWEKYMLKFNLSE